MRNVGPRTWMVACAIIAVCYALMYFACFLAQATASVPSGLPRAWERSLHRSALPTAPFKVQRGYGHHGDTIAISTPGLVTTYGYLDATQRMHEAGHQFNLYYMTLADEQQFAVEVLGETPQVSWWFDTNFLGTPICEEFAEIYTVLARHPHIKHDYSKHWDNEGYFLRDLTASQVARARVLIRSFARPGYHDANVSGWYG